MLEINEEKLIEKAKLGDKEAFGQLIMKHERRVYNVALQMVKNEEDAKDIAQDALIKVYRNINKFSGKSSFTTWIHRVTMNTALDALRKKKSRKEKDTYSLDERMEVNKDSDIHLRTSQADMPEDVLLRQERKDALEDALQELKEDHRSVIVLREIQGLSYQEIAEVLETSEGTVKSRINRGRKKLKEILMDMELFKRKSV